MVFKQPSNAIKATLVASIALLNQGTTNTASSFDLSKNPYMAPGPNDGRSPCPALSALANHGFINRDGRAISTNELALISAEVFSISNQSAHFVMEKNIQLGMPHEVVGDDIIFDLETTKVVDRDVSFAWLDRTFRNVDEPNQCLVQNLLDLAGDSPYLTPDDMDEYIRIRYADSKKFNKNFKFNEHTIGLVVRVNTQAFLSKMLASDLIARHATCDSFLSRSYLALVVAVIFRNN